MPELESLAKEAEADLLDLDKLSIADDMDIDLDIDLNLDDLDDR